MAVEMTYEAPDGRLFKVLVPEHDKAHPERGIRVGPPELDKIGLPLGIMIRLHNSLFHRNIFTEADFRNRRDEAFGALQAALAVDVERIYQEYVNANPPAPNSIDKPESSAHATGRLSDDAVLVSTSEGVREARANARQQNRS